MHLSSYAVYIITDPGCVFWCSTLFIRLDPLTSRQTASPPLAHLPGLGQGGCGDQSGLGLAKVGRPKVLQVEPGGDLVRSGVKSSTDTRRLICFVAISRGAESARALLCLLLLERGPPQPLPDDLSHWVCSGLESRTATPWMRVTGTTKDGQKGLKGQKANA